MDTINGSGQTILAPAYCRSWQSSLISWFATINFLQTIPPIFHGSTESLRDSLVFVGALHVHTVLPVKLLFVMPQHSQSNEIQRAQDHRNFVTTHGHGRA